MPAILSVNFGVEVLREPETRRNKAENLQGRFAEKFAEAFVGNFLKSCQTK